MDDSAVAMRVADHLRPLLFSYVFVEGLSVRAAVERISEERRVFIPKPVAEALVREENARRSAAQKRENTAKLTDAVGRVEVRRKSSFELPANWEHTPSVAFVKGCARVTCSCGERVCNLPRTDVDAIERAWFEHRDGKAAWKKE